MLSSIMRNVSNITRTSAFHIAVFGAALTLGSTGLAYAQADEDEEEEASEEEGEVEEEEAEDEADEEAPSPPKLRIEAGAPRPPAQTPGIAPPTLPPGSAPPPPTIKLGGAFILAYFQPYNMGEEAFRQARPRPESNFETFRAAILLDSKIDRFGVHIEFRARDKRVREFFEGTSWLEEIYGSVDVIRPENPTASAVLKVGKSFAQFGRYWDDSFYGNIHLRDGLKLDSNYGLSLEGQVGKRQIGAKFFGQYFILDGGTNTSLNNRDTISVAAPLSGHPPSPPAGGGSSISLGRRRNQFVGRIEPFYAFNPTMSVKVAGSITNFTADFGPTFNQENVTRYGGDATINLAWFSAWAEYTVQKGRHVLNQPFAASGPIAANDPWLTPDLPRSAPWFRGERAASVGGQSSRDVHYLLAGGRFFYKGIMLRYNYSQANYNNVTYPSTAQGYAALAGLGITPAAVDVKETMHVPGIMISATQQLFLMIEAPVHKRHIPGVPASFYEGTRLPAALQAPGAGFVQPTKDIVIDRSIVVTLHARI